MAFTGKWFKTKYYLEQNSDVASQWGGTALEHYMAWGATEGRAPNAWFDAQYYRANNPDLDAAGLTGLALFAHYENYGYMEGRAPSATYANFDEAAYLADYSDLGTNGITADTALNHYLTFGIDEGRVGKNDNGTTISSNTGSTFTLTTGADALTGTEGNDTFVGTEASLSSADVLDGAGGTDTLRYASSGAAAVIESGFEANSIETVQVTSDATGGTAFDVTGVDDLATLRNFNSSEGLNATGLKSLVNVELSNIGSAGAGANDPTPDTQLVFKAATVAGTSDALSVTLDSNLNVDGTAIGDLQANGIETFNVTTQNGATSMGQIASNSLLSVTVAGDQDLTLGTVLTFANDGTVDASTFTGDLDVTVNSGLVDVTVTGGTGDDRADFSAGFDTGDSFDGGEGTDTLAVTNAVAAGTPAGAVANIEQLEISTAGTGTVDMDDFSGVTKVIYDAGITAAATATVDDAVTGITVEVDATAAGTDNLVVDLKTDGTADEITLEFDEIAAGDAIASVNAADAETLNMSFDDDTANGTGTFTMTSLTATDATSMILTGDADFTLTNTVDPATPALATIDASGMTGDVTISGTNTAAAGATITFGSGDDTFNVATSNGADTITLGTGADTIRYTTIAQSDRDMDTITDFVSGTDTIDLSYNAAGVATNWGASTFITSTQFAGSRASFGLAQGALAGGAVVNVVYQEDDQILWLDANGDGTLDNRDFRVQLTDVDSITAADLGFVTGNAITLNAPAANVGLAVQTNASNVSTQNDDTITSTYANLVGSTVDGGNGADTLNVTDAVTAAFNFNPNFTNIGTYNLMAGSSAIVTIQNGAGVATTAGDQAIVTLGTGGQTFTGSADDDTLTIGAALAGVTDTVDMGAGDDSVTGAAGNSDITLGAGDDTFNAAAGDDTVDGGAGIDTFNFAAAGRLDTNDDIDGGAGADILNATDTFAATDLDNVTNVETINLSLAAASAITSVNGLVAAGSTVTIDHTAGNFALTFNGAAETDGDFVFSYTAGGATASDVLTGGAGDDVFNYAANTSTINLSGGAGDDTFNMGVNLTSVDIINGGLGTDTLNFTDATAAVTDLNLVTNVENVVFGAAATSVTTVAALVAAGETINFDATALAANALTLNLAVETDGQVNVDLTGTTGGSTLTMTSNNLVDTYTLSTAGGPDVFGSNANNIVANVGNADVIVNFKAAGIDQFSAGVGTGPNLANAAGIVVNVAVNGTTAAAFAGDVNAALLGAGHAATGNTDVYTVSVTGSGALDGDYLIQDFGGDLCDAADFLVELQGTTGVIAAADFIA